LEEGTKKSGIYVILNYANGKTYVGATEMYVSKRLNYHKSMLRLGKHPNQYLQTDYNEYGQEEFGFACVKYCAPELLDHWEKHFIDLYESSVEKNGYNIWGGGKEGRKAAQETKDKISNSLKGKDPIKARLKSYESIRKKVINLDTNEVYASIVDAAKALNIHEQTARDWLKGRKEKKANITFYNIQN
jgi:group I intron endonuclease